MMLPGSVHWSLRRCSGHAALLTDGGTVTGVVLSCRRAATPDRSPARQRSRCRCADLLAIRVAQPQIAEIEDLLLSRGSRTHGRIVAIAVADIGEFVMVAVIQQGRSRRPDRVSAARCPEFVDLVTASLAFQKAGGNDRDEERRRVEPCIDLLPASRCQTGSSRYPEIFRPCADQRPWLQFVEQPLAQSAQAATRMLVVQPRVAPKSDRLQHCRA